MNEEDYRCLGKKIPETLQNMTRVDKHLGLNFPFHSRTTWTKLVKQEKVLINGSKVKPGYTLHVGDQISYYSPQAEEPTVNKDIRLVWQGEGIMALEKPANLPMHEGGAYRKNTFHELLIEKYGPEWAAVHRLDRETSGLVLCGATPELRDSLSEALRERKVLKHYLAIAPKGPSEPLLKVEQPIGLKEETSFRTKNWVSPKGQRALTSFKLREKGAFFVLMDVFPYTGRTHQIRVHSAWSGWPLVGDKKYCLDESIYLEYLEKGFTSRVKQAVGYDRLCLHAHAISFPCPQTKKVVKVECSMPDDFKLIWQKLKDKPSW